MAHTHSLCLKLPPLFSGCKRELLRTRIARTAWVSLACLALLSGGAVVAGESRESLRQKLGYAPAPVNNPLKGLVPYASNAADATNAPDRFPHSLEFDYIPLSALVTGCDQYDWRPLENLLEAIAGRGHQAVFRVFIEYPGKRNVIPGFLIAGGLKVHQYQLGQEEIQTPDYSDLNLRKVIKQFIAALGQKYDGDPRIGFITAGLLGAWGEWHDYPRNDLFASKEVQAEVMDAYEGAFQWTPVLLRYPAGEGRNEHQEHAPNAERRFGFHDDSFAWSTLETGRKGDEWFFMARLKAAGPAALDKWKTQPIGGEIRPEAWGKVFDPDPGLKQIQDFRKCVHATHASWLMDSGMFQSNEPIAARTKRAEEEVRGMGYEFHVPAVTTGPVIDGTLEFTVEIENRGVAPFYHEWPVECGLLSPAGNLIKTFPSPGKLPGILPGDKPRLWNQKVSLQGVKPGRYFLALRVANPLPKGLPVRFANATQDQHAFGWLTLCPLNVGAARSRPEF